MHKLRPWLTYANVMSTIARVRGSRRRGLGRLGTFTLLALVALLALAPSAFAAPQTFTVDSLADTGSLACDNTIASDCTLRSAVQKANADANPSDTDLINFNA